MMGFIPRGLIRGFAVLYVGAQEGLEQIGVREMFLKICNQKGWRLETIRILIGYFHTWVL